jgi:hypothetical protein
LRSELACQIRGSNDAFETAPVVHDEDVAARADFIDQAEKFFMPLDRSDLHQRIGDRCLGVAKERLRDRFPGHASSEILIVVDHCQLGVALQHHLGRCRSNAVVHSNPGDFEVGRAQCVDSVRRLREIRYVDCIRFGFLTACRVEIRLGAGGYQGDPAVDPALGERRVRGQTCTTQVLFDLRDDLGSTPGLPPRFNELADRQSEWIVCATGSGLCQEVSRTPDRVQILVPFRVTGVHCVVKELLYPRGGIEAGQLADGHCRAHTVQQILAHRSTRDVSRPPLDWPLVAGLGMRVLVVAVGAGDSPESDLTASTLQRHHYVVADLHVVGEAPQLPSPVRDPSLAAAGVAAEEFCAELVAIGALRQVADGRPADPGNAFAQGELFPFAAPASTDQPGTHSAYLHGKSFSDKYIMSPDRNIVREGVRRDEPAGSSLKPVLGPI